MEKTYLRKKPGACFGSTYTKREARYSKYVGLYPELFVRKKMESPYEGILTLCVFFVFIWSILECKMDFS